MTTNVKERYDTTFESNETTMDPSQSHQVHVETDPKRTFSELVKTEEFSGLLKKKKAFILPASIFFLTYYFMLPILSAYTDVLKGDAFFGLTWAWVYALSQFAVVWIGGIVYMKNAAKYDKTVEEILTKHKEELEK